MSIVRTEDCSQECFKVDWNQHKKYCKQIAKLGGWRDSEDCAEGVGVIILAEELRIQKLTQKSAEHMVLGFALPGDNTILSKTEADSALMQQCSLTGCWDREDTSVAINRRSSRICKRKAGMA